MSLSAQDYERMRERLRRLNPKLKQPDTPVDTRNWSRTQLQEYEAGKRARALHRAESEKVDADVRRQFRVTVTLRISDKRKRDADGALSTILDCLCKSTRRLSERDT